MAGVDTWIRLPDDSTNLGKEVRAWSNVVGTDTVYAQAFVETNIDGIVLGGDAGGRYIQGGVASGATDSGRPVKVGGVYNSVLPTIVSGQRADLQVTSSGVLFIVPANAAGAVPNFGDLSIDGHATSGYGFHSRAFLHAFNGSTWDRVRVANTGRLQVDVITGGGGGTQYTEDVAVISAAGVVTLAGARASIVAPTSMSADGDAVALWATRRGALVVEGGVASGVTDSGNPVKVGGVYNSTLPTLISGQRSDLQVASSGVLMVDTEMPAAVALSDSLANPTAPIVGAAGLLWNSTTYERTRSPLQGDLQVATGITAVGPYAYNGSTQYDRIRTIDALKTAIAAPDIGVLAAMAPDRRFISVSLATAANSQQTWDVNGAVDAHVTVGTTTTGTVIFEVTNDGTNWTSAEVYDGATELWVPGALTPTSGKTYRVFTAGWRTLRTRVVTLLGATVGLITTLSSTPAIIRAIDTGPAPHQYGYTETAATAQYTVAQTSTVLGPTVAAGQRMVVLYYQIQAGGTTAGTVQLYFGTGAYVRGTNKAVFDGEFAPSATLKPGVVQTKQQGWIGALDEELRVTDSTAINPLTITIWYYLIG